MLSQLLQEGQLVAVLNSSSLSVPVSFKNHGPCRDFRQLRMERPPVLCGVNYRERNLSTCWGSSRQMSNEIGAQDTTQFDLDHHVDGDLLFCQVRRCMSFVWDTIFMINSLKIPVCKIIVNGWGGSLCSAMLLFVSIFETTGGSKWTCTGIGTLHACPFGF